MDSYLDRDWNGLVDHLTWVELADGTSVSAHIRGTGCPPIVVIITGVGDSTSSHGYQKALLADATFIEVDRPGIGLSPPRPDPLAPVNASSMAVEYAEAFRGLCDTYELPANDLTVVSHSFGGNIAPLLIEMGPDWGLRFRRWLDLDGSVPELMIDPKETGLVFDGPVYELCNTCVRPDRDTRYRENDGETLLRSYGHLVGLNRALRCNPFDLVTTNNEVRCAELPHDLQYVRITRDPEFHPTCRKIRTTRAMERHWWAQGIAKTLALGDPESAFMVVARKTGHAFCCSDTSYMQYSTKPGLPAEVLRRMISPLEEPLTARGADLTSIMAAGGRIHELGELLDMAEELDLPEPRGRNFAGVPSSPLLRNPQFRKVFEETQARRGPLGLTSWAAQEAPDVLEALERFSQRYPELAGDPVSWWLPSDHVLAETRKRMLAGLEPDKAAKQSRASGRRKAQSTHWTRTRSAGLSGGGIRR